VLATVFSATLSGLEGRVVRVEVDVAPGLPGFTIVGLPDAALQEARERVRGAIRNSGFEFPPRRITVNLAPAKFRLGSKASATVRHEKRPRSRRLELARPAGGCAGDRRPAAEPGA
jgi:hypothetical protein